MVKCERERERKIEEEKMDGMNSFLSGSLPPTALFELFQLRCGRWRRLDLAGGGGGGRRF